MKKALIFIPMVLAALKANAGTSQEIDPFGKSIQVDPFAFAYYRNRTPESIASEIEANGYSAVRLIIHCEDDQVDQVRQLVNAFHQRKIAVWCETFGNGTYRPSCLPKGWEKWRMKLKGREAHDVSPGFVYLCINNPEYRKWKKKQVAALLRRVNFDGFEIMEPFLPAVNGPISDCYGCLCDYCVRLFLKAYPEENNPPDFTNETNPRYYTKDWELYQKWVEFRCNSVASFQDFIINSPGGVRDVCPRIKVAAWGIAGNVSNPVETIREWQGSDGALIVKTVKPDLYVIQTDWPDWTTQGLRPDYVLAYSPFVEAVRRVSNVPIILQTDVGSKENCRRGKAWLSECEEAGRNIGMAGVTAYEYHLNLDIYDSEPRPLWAVGVGNTVTIVFNKRLDEGSATKLENYSVRYGTILSSELDGNMVKLQVTGRPTEITVGNVMDDADSRFFKNHPSLVMTKKKTVVVKWCKTSLNP